MNKEQYENDLNKYLKHIDFNILKDKSILITGATGLIGSYLIDLLIKKNEQDNLNVNIYAVSRSENKLKDRFNTYYDNSHFHPVIQDVCTPFKIEAVDYIIHGASNTHPVAYSTDPVGTITTNVLGLYNLLNLAVETNVKKFIFLSSVEIYGENKTDKDSFDESDFGYIDCNTLRAGYPESKRLGEALCQAYHSKYNLDIVIPRISRVYGPTIQKTDTKALSQFINNVLEDKDIVLKSEGTQYFSYSYVGDVVSAIILLISKGLPGEAYNIADSKSDIRLKDLANLIAGVGNKKVIFELPNETEKKGFSKATKAIINPEKLNNLGYVAITHIEEGIEATIKILKKQQ